VSARPLVWALHDGRVGIANQVIGLTNTLSHPYDGGVCAAGSMPDMT